MLPLKRAYACQLNRFNWLILDLERNFNRTTLQLDVDCTGICIHILFIKGEQKRLIVVADILSIGLHCNCSFCFTTRIDSQFFVQTYCLYCSALNIFRNIQKVACLNLFQIFWKHIQNTDFDEICDVIIGIFNYNSGKGASSCFDVDAHLFRCQ